MGNLRASFAAVTALGLVACGSDKAKPDAPTPIDAPIDSKPIDAAPDAPAFDLSCAGNPLPTTADDPVSAAGTTNQVTLSGPAVLGMTDVSVFKVGQVAPLKTTQSDVATGAYMFTGIATGGVPLDAYLEASHADVVNMMTTTKFRTTFVFPPQPVTKSLPQVPILIASTDTFTMLAGIAGATQDDTTNGALFIAVTDCGNKPVTGATLSVKQGGTDVGMIFDLGQLSQMAAGLYFVFNVPDGNTDVNASLGATTFLGHTVIAFKKSNKVLNGSMTTTIVRPGPL